MSKKGIDVSVWQGDINWNKVKNAGIEFAIIRSGWGWTEDGQKDKFFDQNIKNAKAAGVKVGVYHYSYASSVENAKQEAEYCLSIVKSAGVKLDLPIYFDIEDKSIANNHDKDTRTNMCIAFCSEIEKAGYWAGVYANLNWYNNYLNKDELKKRYTLWLAQYNNKNDMPCDVWQHTSEGSVDGINGNVDMNIMYRDLISEIGEKGGNTENKKEEKPAQKVTYYRVRSNDTLSGIAEIFNTTYQYLAEINGLDDPDLIFSGQTLIVPDSSLFQKPYIEYRIKSGDTLSEIAERYNTTYRKIAEDNDITDPNEIYPNQVIKIYR